MYWSKPQRNWRDVWGYRFEWTSEHLTPEDLRPMISTYDVLGSECLDRLDSISPPEPPPRPGEKEEKEAGGGEATGSGSGSGSGPDEKSNHGPRRDLFALLREHAGSDDKLGELWSQVNTVPDWVDWDQIERGQQVFYRYGGPAVVAVSRP